MSDRTDYPPAYRPGIHWATDQAWEILDCLKEGAIPQETRFVLAGIIVSALMQAAEKGTEQLKREWTRAQ